MIRLDKFLCDALDITRKQAGLLVKKERVQVDGILVKNGAIKIDEKASVLFDDAPLYLSGPRYIMLHKPAGYVCSHEDTHNPTLFSLLDEIGAEKLHIAGRLDCDTTGLVLLTDDGQWSHRVTSPKHKCDKLYRVCLADPILANTVTLFEKGIRLRGEKQDTLPAKMTLLSDTQALLRIYEGKYHQIKRMFAAVGNKVIGLHRISIGDLVLDEQLLPGEYRALTEDEINLFLPN